MKKSTALLIIFTVYRFLSFAQYPQYDYVAPTSPPPYDNVGTKPGYTLNFNDGFDGVSQLDNIKWHFGGPSSSTYSYYGANAYNGSQCVTFQNNDVGNQSLVLSLKTLSTPIVYNSTNYYYVSEVPETVKPFGYGYYEARIKLGIGPGANQAFWLWGATGIQCPANLGKYSEIDIFEDGPASLEARMTTQNVHTFTNWYVNGCSNTNVIGTSPWVSLSDAPADNNIPRYYTGPLDLKDEYHVYGFKFTPDSMVWYIDNYPFRYAVNGTYSNITALFNSVLLNAMEITFSNGAQPASPGIIDGYVNYQTPSTINMYIDYVRYFKQNPTITTTASECITPGENMDFFGTTGIPNDTYTWKAISGCTFKSAVMVGNNETSEAIFTSTGTGPVVVQVTATDINGYTSTSTYSLPYISTAFTIGAPFCTGNNINVSVTCPTLPSNVGSEFQLFTLSNGGMGTLLQTAWGNSGTTFTYPLTQGQQYFVTHGVYDNCTPWTSSAQILTVNLTNFTYTPLTCSSTGLQTTATALSNTGGAYQWNLYNCNSSGVILGPLLSPTPAWGTSITLNTLQPGQYYSLSLGTYNGSCITNWTSTAQVIFAPLDNTDPGFNCTNICAIGNNNSSQVQVTSSYTGNPGSEYALYVSNSAGVALSQVGTWTFGNSVSYKINFTTNPYYLVVHGTYSSCGAWEGLGRLISNPCYGGGGIHSPTNDTNSSDNSPVIQFTAEQKQYFEKSMLHSFMPDSIQAENYSLGLQVSPNPVSGECKITLSERMEDGTIQLENMNAQILYSIAMNGSTNYTINMAKYPEGVYVVRAISDKKTGFAKLVHIAYGAQ